MKATKPCPECGGRKFGRGYNHNPGCSLASKVNGKPVKRSGRKGMRNNQRVGASPSIDTIRRMPIEAVIEIRRAADAVLKARHPEVRRMITELKNAVG